MEDQQGQQRRWQACTLAASCQSNAHMLRLLALQLGGTKRHLVLVGPSVATPLPAALASTWHFKHHMTMPHNTMLALRPRWLGSCRFAVTLLDAPGHKDFVPAMISGAAQADAAILVVDGSHGGFEASFQAARSADGAAAHGRDNAGGAQHSGQLREHVHVARSMGIKQLAIAITKLDTCEFSEARFREVQGQLEPFLGQCGYKDVQWLPAAAPAGQNVSTAPTESRLAAWWPGGHTLLDAIDAFQPVARASRAL